MLTAFTNDLTAAISRVEATLRRGVRLDVNRAMEKFIVFIEGVSRRSGKLILIGNGGSASIASHQAIDFWKNGGVKAVSFNDAASLTCLGNDFGYEYVFEKPVEVFAEKRDMLIAISSSGRSGNILRAVRMARRKRLKIVTLSGFGRGNPLRGKGDINFYVPSGSYGTVEVAHLAICHSLAGYFARRYMSRRRGKKRYAHG